ncbi:MAG: hypothetical protein CMO40_09915, partial [Verrucomicrobiaceae bacterium]|nr:hypothetical protein [Verrucomicrobiaceae bacterium]
MKHTISSLALVTLLLSACGGSKEEDQSAKEDSSNPSQTTNVEPYGKLEDGTEVKIFTFSNKNGM